MGSLVPLARRMQLAPKSDCGPRTAPRQLDLVLDNARLRSMTSVERQAAVLSLAHLMLEAGGVAVQEVGDDNP